MHEAPNDVDRTADDRSMASRPAHPTPGQSRAMRRADVANGEGDPAEQDAGTVDSNDERPAQGSR